MSLTPAEEAKRRLSRFAPIGGQSAEFYRLIDAVEAVARTEALASVRQYVKNNLDAWDPGITLAEATTGSQQLEVAYADIYRKVLNVIDTGDPMQAKA